MSKSKMVNSKAAPGELAFFIIMELQKDSKGQIIQEIWEDAKGFTDYYKVSNYGRVKSLPRSGTNGRILVLCTTRGGYLKVCLSVFNKNIHRSVHQLVAQTFIKNPKKLKQVNHINGNKKDNTVWNLEWCTGSDNLKHAYRIGIKSSRGEKHSQNKLTWIQVGIIREAIAAGHSKTEIAKYFKIGWRHVYHIHANESWVIQQQT